MPGYIPLLRGFSCIWVKPYFHNTVLYRVEYYEYNTFRHLVSTYILLLNMRNIIWHGVVETWLYVTDERINMIIYVGYWSVLKENGGNPTSESFLLILYVFNQTLSNVF